MGEEWRWSSSVDVARRRRAPSPESKSTRDTKTNSTSFANCTFSPLSTIERKKEIKQASRSFFQAEGMVTGTGYGDDDMMRIESAWEGSGTERG